MHLMKKCNKCKQILEYSMFAKNCTQKDGFENYCKSCKNTYNKKNYGNKFTKAYLKKAGYGIYKLENLITGECYIGKGWLNERKIDHFTKLRAQKHSKPYLQNSFNQNNNFEFIILEKIPEELGYEKERMYILDMFFNKPNKLLNQHVTLR